MGQRHSTDSRVKPMTPGPPVPDAGLQAISLPSQAAPLQSCHVALRPVFKESTGVKPSHRVGHSLGNQQISLLFLFSPQFFPFLCLESEHQLQRIIQCYTLFQMEEQENSSYTHHTTWGSWRPSQIKSFIHSLTECPTLCRELSKTAQPCLPDVLQASHCLTAP